MASEDVTPPDGAASLPWPSEFELDIKARLADVESHLSRVDRLLIELQGEGRRIARKAAETQSRIESKVESLVALVRALGVNGSHG